MTPVNSQNRFLPALPRAALELLRPHLRPTKLDQRSVLYSTGDRVDHVYFPDSGVISLVVELADGQMVEAAMVGSDSVLGAASALDGQLSLNKAIVQIGGAGLILDAVRMRDIADKNVEFRASLMRHEQALFAQAQQAGACNVSHAVESRLARWLLRARDLSGSDSLPLTQEYLAQMLGVRRTTVTLVAGTLQNAGLIQYSRGHINITQPNRLRELACECYETVKRNYDRLSEKSHR